METKKSFVGLENAHAFFVERSTQLNRAIDAIAPIVERHNFSRKRLHVCFFGCGDIELGLRLIEVLERKHVVNVALVDMHRGWLDDAVRKIQSHGTVDVSTHQSLEGVSAPLDLIVAHHTMYYVPDLPKTLQNMHQLLDRDGILITALAARSNKLKQCAVELFRLKGKMLPYWQQEDLEAALSANGLAWDALSVPSAVDCTDSTASRTALINFLMGTLETPSQEALAVFTPYENGVRLHIPMTDSVTIYRRGGPSDA